jgi:hypothetical protein
VLHSASLTGAPPGPGSHRSRRARRSHRPSG